MKTVLALALFVGVALCNSSALFGWQPNQEFVYRFETQVASGVPSVRNQFAGMKLSSNVVVQTFPNFTLRIKMLDPKFIIVNQDLPNKDGRPEIPQPRQEVPEELRRPLEQPFEVKLKRGVVEAISVEENEPVAVTNIKRSLVSQLQLDLSASRRHEIPNGMPNAQMRETNVDPNQVRYFSTEETTLLGDCQTDYTINRLPKFQAQEIESRIKISQKELEEMNVIPKEKSQDSERLCGDKPYFEVVKTKNLDNCKQRPIYQSVQGIVPKCDVGKAACSNLITTLTSTRYIICGSLDEYIIREVETNNDILTNPMGFHITKEEMISIARVNLMLLSRKSGGFSPMPVPSGAKQIKSLIFEFPIGNPLSSKGSKGMTPGQPMPEEGFQPVLPKPDLKSANYILPSPMPFEQLKRQLVSEFEKVIEEIRQNPDTCGSKTDLAGRVSAIALYLRPLSFQQLKEVEREVLSQRNDSQEIARQLWYDIVVMSGTNPSIMLIKEKIQSRQLTNAQATKLMQSVMRAVKTPTEELLKELLQLVKEVKNSGKSQEQSAHNAGLINLANLVHDACLDPTARVTRFPSRIYGRFCSEKSDFVKGELLGYLIRGAQESQSNQERLVFIASLGKIGHRDIFRPLLQIIKSSDNTKSTTSKSTLTRSMAVYALKRLGKLEPTLVKPVLLQLIDNPAEEPEIRMAAIAVLPWTQPSSAELSKIATRSWFEPSKQVAGFIYSTIKNLVRTKVPELKAVALQARNVEKMAKPMQFGVQFANNQHSQVFVEYLKAAHSFENSYINSPKTLFPARMAFSSKLFGNAWQLDGLNLDIYSQGMDTFIDNVLVQLGYQPETSQEVRQQLEQLNQQLNIKKREGQSTESVIHFGFMGFEKVWAADKSFYNEVLHKATSLLRSASESVSSEERLHYNLTQSYFAVDVQEVGGSEAGFPLVITRNMPVLLSIKGYAQREQNTLQTTIIPVINSKVQNSIGILASFTREFIGSGVEMALHSSLPLTIEAEAEAKSEFKIAARIPKQIQKEIELIHLLIKPYTVVKKLRTVEPLGKSSSGMKTILSGQPIKPFEKRIGKAIGLDTQLRASSDYEVFDFGYVWEKLRQHDFWSMFSAGSMVPSLRMASVQLTHNPITSATKEIEAAFNLVHGRKIENEESQMEFPIESRIEQQEESRIQQQCSRKHQLTFDVERCVAKGLKHLEARREAHQEAKQMLNKMNKNGYACGLHLSAGLNSDVGSNQAISTMVVISNEKSDGAIRTEAKAMLKTPNMPKAFVKVDIDTKLPLIPYRWNIQELINEQVQMKSSAQVKYGILGLFEESVEMNFDLRKSEELKESVQKSDLYRECQQNMQQGRRLTDACIETRHMAASVDTIKTNIKLPSSLAESRVIRSIEYFIESYFWTTAKFQPKHESRNENENGQVNIEAFIKVNQTGKFTQIELETPNNRYQVVNATVPRFLQRVFPLSLRNDVTMRMVQKITNDQVPASCRIEPKFVTTFDNQTFEYPLNECEHLLVKDCSNYKLRRPVAVIARRDGNGKYVKILSGDYVVELMPHHDKLGGAVRVKVNGQEENLPHMTSVIKRETRSRKVSLILFRNKDGVVSVNSPIEGLVVFTDAQRIEVVGPQSMRNRACGLCGDLNLENTADVQSPEQCVMSKPRFSGYAYMIQNSHCQERIPEKDREEYNKDKQECSKVHYIPTPVTKLGQKLAHQIVPKSGRSMAHVVEVKKNQICISQARIRICGGKNEEPEKAKPTEMSFACMPRRSTYATTLQKRAEAGEEVIDAKYMPTSYTKTVFEPTKCQKTEQKGQQGHQRGQYYGQQNQWNKQNQQGQQNQWDEEEQWNQQSQQGQINQWDEENQWNQSNQQEQENQWFQSNQQEQEEQNQWNQQERQEQNQWNQQEQEEQNQWNQLNQQEQEEQEQNQWNQQYHHGHQRHQKQQGQKYQKYQKHQHGQKYQQEEQQYQAQRNNRF